jgi:protoporphyrinogen oxidase
MEDVTGCFRFEPAGGHWLFGLSPAGLEGMRRFGEFRTYTRRAAVLLADGQLVPFPLQDNLRYLDAPLRKRILDELASPRVPLQPSATFAQWLHASFGPTLCALFFQPFNERYTAGLLRDVAPQDFYKSPVDLDRVRQGALEPVADRGYNQSFHYPEGGLDQLARAIGTGCEIHLSHRVVAIDVEERRIEFGNGRTLGYDHVISTLPLHEMAAMCRLEARHAADPATAVLVVNIAATRGRRCPIAHWVYLAESRSGMHRVGFYSNVDASFLPAGLAEGQEYLSLYAECSYQSTGVTPDDAALAEAARAIVDELKEWGFIEEAMIVEPTFTDPAYTWTRPGSRWATDTIRSLAAFGIQQIGRYGAWRFQGIATSFEEGAAAGKLAAA